MRSGLRRTVATAGLRERRRFGRRYWRRPQMTPSCAAPCGPALCTRRPFAAQAAARRPDDRPAIEVGRRPNRRMPPARTSCGGTGRAGTLAAINCKVRLYASGKLRWRSLRSLPELHWRNRPLTPSGSASRCRAAVWRSRSFDQPNTTPRSRRSAAVRRCRGAESAGRRRRQPCDGLRHLVSRTSLALRWLRTPAMAEQAAHMCVGQRTEVTHRRVETWNDLLAAVPLDGR